MTLNLTVPKLTTHTRSMHQAHTLKIQAKGEQFVGIDGLETHLKQVLADLLELHLTSLKGQCQLDLVPLQSIDYFEYELSYM